MKRKEKIRASLNSLFQKVDKAGNDEKEFETTKSETVKTFIHETTVEKKSEELSIELEETSEKERSAFIDNVLEIKYKKLADLRNKSIDEIYKEALDFYLEFQLDLPEE
ncbi:hypothetical protein [Sediminitomix flava]|uniref:Uncharacterized protein n=1 Tax=Sediminitomix flava TaxID=379075 RepID=A0A315Z7F7_SEDFL|nr:hypothetical protein [Sediminitomix flava]PWJ39140.1 hypothetical protein BC781_10641 [Sediminitomix flava]